MLETKLDPDPVVIGQSNTLIFRNVPQLSNRRTVTYKPLRSLMIEDIEHDHQEPKF